MSVGFFCHPSAILSTASNCPFYRTFLSAKKCALSSIETPEHCALIPLSVANKGIRAPEREPLDATKGAPFGKKISPEKRPFSTRFEYTEVVSCCLNVVSRYSPRPASLKSTAATLS